MHKKILVFVFSFAVVAIGYIFFAPSTQTFAASNLQEKETLFGIQAIDTMKESRDRARAVISDPSYDSKIDAQMRLVKEAGATHVSIATPYDEEFVPVLKRWVASARRHGLSVWFRGNFSGWEGWFDYPRITPSQHLAKTKTFIIAHPELFENGDIFSPCPECENGAMGDPRVTGKVADYRTFLIAEHTTVQAAFQLIGKQVTGTYPSMNADVARLIMDRPTTAALGGMVVIDHYVRTPEQFRQDVINIGNASAGAVALGELGGPIPDLQGYLSEKDQAAYIEKLMGALWTQNDNIPLVNYWVLSDGSTALLNANGTPRAAYEIVRKYFTAPYISGTVVNTLGDRLSGISIQVTDTSNVYTATTSTKGEFRVFVPQDTATISFGSNSYVSEKIIVHRSEGSTYKNVILEPADPSFIYNVREFISKVPAYVQTAAAILFLNK